VNSKKIIVIGSGLGGLSAAISLKQSGYDVEVFEKNDKIGGKLNVLKERGYTFDLGPSILTLPHLFERLFERSGKRMKDYISIRPLRPHWRNFFEDGQVVDLYPEPDKMAAEARKAGEPPENIERFLDYSADLYDLVNAGYFEQGLDTASDFRRFYGLRKFLKFDLFRTMHGGAARFLKTRHLRDIFDYFIKYVGSSAYHSPAFMNCLPTIQFRHDLWYVDGGMYQIALGLRRFMEEIGVRIHRHSEVTQIRTEQNRVTGIATEDGSFHPADVIVSNMEVIPTYRELLREDAALLEKLGKFELADKGTIFLDEIGEMALSLQAKIMRIIQEGEIERVGGVKTIPVDVRVIAATNKDIERAVSEGAFREDLYYRLNVFPIKVPPLRERTEDIPLLVDFFTKKYCAEMKTGRKEVSEEVLSLLTGSPWKGNIRELENSIERAVILCDGVTITTEHISLNAVPMNPHLGTLPTLPMNGTLEDTTRVALRLAESERIRKALQETKGNKSRAAELLDVSYKTLLTKIKEYGIE